MLGFIENQRNNSVLTLKGHELLKRPELTNPLLISSVINLDVYQKLLPYLEISPDGRTRQEILEYLVSITDPDIGQSMIGRRLSTILAWPRTLGFINQTSEGRFQLYNNFNNDFPVFDIKDIYQPILPNTSDLTEYEQIEERVSNAQNEILYYKNMASQERSNNAHTILVNLVAQRIRESGGVPKSNQFIDLAVRFDEDYIFEMKSTTEENERAQIRRGMSQLYEYRYLQNKPSAKLILVIEKSLETNHLWMLDYMEIDRDISLVWDGQEKLYGSEKTRRELEFMGLLP
jgi:hypothetical protein